MQELEVDACDTIRLILQFLKENGLYDSFRTLQKETNVSFNTVDSIEPFLDDVKHGRWESVLRQTKGLALDASLIMDLYELIVIEMAEIRDVDVANQLLQHSVPMQSMKATSLERYKHLEDILVASNFDPNAAYGNTSKQKRRNDLVVAFKQVISTAMPSRLLSLLGQALKWQQMQGLLVPGTNFDLFQGAPKHHLVDQVDKMIQTSVGKLKFSKRCPPQCARFSLDGNILVTGTKDGFIEVWDYEKCKLRKDLEYQAKDEFMMHENAITAEGFSPNGDMLATGSETGQVKVWKLLNGVCLRRFDNAHSQAVHSIAFSRDSTQVLTASFDETVRIHGLRSGNMLKEFRGHNGHVNAAIFSPDGAKVISSSCDGTLRLWSTKTAECIDVFRPLDTSSGGEIDVLCALIIPSNIEESSMIVCTRTTSIYLVHMDLTVKRTYTTEAVYGSSHGMFVSAALSLFGSFLYGLTDKGYLICFDTKKGTLVSVTQVSKEEPFGLCYHPHRNILATYGSDGYVRLWHA